MKIIIVKLSNGVNVFESDNNIKRTNHTRKKDKEKKKKRKIRQKKNENELEKRRELTIIDTKQIKPSN